MRLTLRLATLDDIPILIKHRRGMFEDMATLNGERHHPSGLAAMDAAYAPFARERLNDGRMQAWVITAGDQVAASGAILYVDWLPRPDGQKSVLAYVHSVYTEPDFRHRGLARRILQAMIDECRARSLPRLTLHASDMGRHLYDSLGFEPTNEMRLTLD